MGGKGNKHMGVHPHQDEPISGDDWKAFRKDAAVGICVGARAPLVADFLARVAQC